MPDCQSYYDACGDTRCVVSGRTRSWSAARRGQIQSQTKQAHEIAVDYDHRGAPTAAPATYPVEENQLPISSREARLRPRCRIRDKQRETPCSDDLLRGAWHRNDLVRAASPRPISKGKMHRLEFHFLAVRLEARIISGRGFHPESCRLIWKPTSGFAG
jgi:hypothetical protein